ncbi:MAG: DUF2231 domain-containing protein [Syntrophobacteraceae bacterium]
MGYNHPLHPMFVHTSAGVPTAALLLALAALVSKRPELARSARHCIIIAFSPFRLFSSGLRIGSIITRGDGSNPSP